MMQRHSAPGDGQNQESKQRERNLHGGTPCECCGNEYDKSIEVIVNGISHYFDCFECAIHTLAPTCSHCGCKIIGHGVESGGSFYCCAHCADKQGVTAIVDRT
jgi:hypothetical protein